MNNEYWRRKREDNSIHFPSITEWSISDIIKDRQKSHEWTWIAFALGSERRLLFFSPSPLTPSISFSLWMLRMVVSSLITRRMRNIYKITSTYGARAYAISANTHTPITHTHRQCINLLTIAKQQSCYKFVSFAFEIAKSNRNLSLDSDRKLSI